MRRKRNPTDWESIFGVVELLELLVNGLRLVGKLALIVISFFD
ncbi:hypothetical protein [Hymenobacter sediminis]|nr:hypothetical protein [Hymenobacter sediminis]